MPGVEGPATDRDNQPVVDPTRNVLDLVEAANRRQDDLRDYAERHLLSIIDRDAVHAKELRVAEADRINAIRAVDVAAVQRASEVANQQAATLALQVSTTADAFRAALVAALEPIQKRIDDLSRAQYEAQGQKGQISEQRSSSGATVALVGLGVSILLGLIVVITLVVGGGTP